MGDQTRLASLQPGAAFGSYILQRRLARGGMGEIWLAELQGNLGFSKRVVVKTILEHFIEEASAIKMFLEEGRLAAGLQHPNIVQTYDLGQVGETYFMALEYVHGHNLQEVLTIQLLERRQLLPLNLVLRIAAQACEGLHYAHTWKTPDGRPAGIVHRDISPQNILMTFDGTVKIVDFGIARAMSGAVKTRSGVIKGKCGYMAPEQILATELDGRADLFSLGVVMHEMLTGRRLFKRESEMAALQAILSEEILLPSLAGVSVPQGVEEVVMRALARSPSQRFASARDMQVALEELMLAPAFAATSVHLSTHMHELFSEDIEANQRKLQELKRRMASQQESQQTARSVEQTRPYTAVLSSSRGGESRADTVGVSALTGPEKGRGMVAWLVYGLLFLALAGVSVTLVLALGGARESLIRPQAPDGGMVILAPARAAALDAGVPPDIPLPLAQPADVRPAPPTKRKISSPKRSQPLEIKLSR